MAENYTIETDIIYEGNGAVKEFPITFSFSDENEVVVYLNGEVIRRGYSIDGDSVVFNVAPADGDEIALAKATVDAPEEEESTSGESSESGSDTVYDQASREHIKINPVPAKVKYSGNGEVTEFPTGFAFFENDNIIVYLNGAIISSGYSVTGVGETEGGSVIFDEAPKEGDKIVILRQVAIERVTDFQEGGAFRAKNINDELDRQTAFCQQIQEQIDRCVKVEVTEDQTPEELLAEVYGKLDSATEVAQEAVDAATAATEAVASAEKTLAEVNTYVDESKTEINALITKTTTEIDQTIAEATEEIKEAAVAEADKAVQETIGTMIIDAATSAEHARIWAEGEQAEVETLGGELSSRGFADFAYAIANAPEGVPLDNSNLIALDIVKGEKGDKGDKGDRGTDGKDGVDGNDGKDGKDGAGRNVGDIFYTTRTDTALNGAVACDGAVYDIGDFSGEQSIGNLLANGSLPYVSLSEHASQVSSSGVCRVFGWDGGAEFKVPTIPAILLTKTQADVIGDGGTFKLANAATAAPGNVTTGGNSSVDGRTWMHASFSNGTAYVSTTGDSGMLTKFPVIQYRAMVQLATTMTDDALVTATTTLHEARSLADEAVTRLNGFDETVDDAEVQINALVEDALERIEHAGDLNTNHMSITYWE